MRRISSIILLLAFSLSQLGYAGNKPKNYIDFTLRTDAPSAREGRAYYNATEDLVFIYNGSSYVAVATETYSGTTGGATSSMEVTATSIESATGTTITASSIIPAGSLVLGVTTRILTAFGLTNGLTSISVGDGSDVDKWSVTTTTVADATTDMTDFTGTQPAFYAAANDVVVTGNGDGGNEFDATGTIRIDVHYITLTPPSS